MDEKFVGSVPQQWLEELEIKYKILLEFAKQIHKRNRTYSGDAEKLLKEIGEL